MPRKKRIEEDDDIETQARVIEVDPQDHKVRRLMQMMPGGLKCLQVFRYAPGSKGGRPTYIDDISPEQFDFKTMKSMFGGGKFQVKWDNEDGSVSKGDFDIAGPYINFDHQPEVERQPEPVLQSAPIQQAVAQQPQGLDPMLLFKMMQDARREAREEMRTMLEYLRPQQQSPDVTKQVFDIVEKIAPMMAGGDGGGSPWMMALAQFKEPILKIVDSVHVALTRPNVPPVPAQFAQSIQPPVGNPPSQPQEEDMIKLLVKQYLPVFVNAARTGGDVGIYADMVLEQVPRNLYPKLEGWLNGVWFEDLKSFDKNIEYQAGWWNELRMYILEGVKPDASSNLQPATDSQHSED